MRSLRLAPAFLVLLLAAGCAPLTGETRATRTSPQDAAVQPREGQRGAGATRTTSRPRATSSTCAPSTPSSRRPRRPSCGSRTWTSRASSLPGGARPLPGLREAAPHAPQGGLRRLPRGADAHEGDAQRALLPAARRRRRTRWRCRARFSALSAFLRSTRTPSTRPRRRSSSTRRARRLAEHELYVARLLREARALAGGGAPPGDAARELPGHARYEEQALFRLHEAYLKLNDDAKRQGDAAAGHRAAAGHARRRARAQAAGLVRSAAVSGSRLGGGRSSSPLRRGSRWLVLAPRLLALAAGPEAEMHHRAQGAPSTGA